MPKCLSTARKAALCPLPGSRPSAHRQQHATKERHTLRLATQAAVTMQICQLRARLRFAPLLNQPADDKCDKNNASCKRSAASQLQSCSRWLNPSARTASCCVLPNTSVLRFGHALCRIHCLMVFGD
jgi:hypothetical protein